jgi:hypothetical protein
LQGFYFDDYIPESGGFPDPFPNMTEDMGLTPEIQYSLAKSYEANMQVIYNEVLARGMFSWQQLWNGQGNPSDKNGCCTSPLVHKSQCASDLRKLCTADSPAQSRLMQYSFSPGGCQGDPGALTDPEQDIANFLLVRGPYGKLKNAADPQTTQPHLFLTHDSPSETLQLCLATAGSAARVIIRCPSRSTGSKYALLRMPTRLTHSPLTP